MRLQQPSLSRLSFLGSCLFSYLDMILARQQSWPFWPGNIYLWYCSGLGQCISRTGWHFLSAKSGWQTKPNETTFPQERDGEGAGCFVFPAFSRTTASVCLRPFFSGHGLTSYGPRPGLSSEWMGQVNSSLFLWVNGSFQCTVMMCISMHSLVKSSR